MKTYSHGKFLFKVKNQTLSLKAPPRPCSPQQLCTSVEFGGNSAGVFGSWPGDWCPSELELDQIHQNDIYSSKEKPNCANRKAFDSSTTTFFRSDGKNDDFNPWLMIDLGQTYTVLEVIVDNQMIADNLHAFLMIFYCFQHFLFPIALESSI